MCVNLLCARLAASTGDVAVFMSSTSPYTIREQLYYGDEDFVVIVRYNPFQKMLIVNVISHNF